MSKKSHGFSTCFSTRSPGTSWPREAPVTLGTIARGKELFRAVRDQACVTGRSVIITDDGIATGSTMMAAIQAVKAQNPREVIVAVPVASADRLEDVRRVCDEVICLLTPAELYAVGQFYADFSPVEDEKAVKLFRRTVLPFSWSERAAAPCNS